MSDRKLYVLYDVLGEGWVGEVLCAAHPAPIVRSFHDLLRDGKSVPGQHPADYQILCVGVIAVDGTILAYSPPQVIATGEQWLVATQTQREAANVQ